MRPSKEQSQGGRLVAWDIWKRRSQVVLGRNFVSTKMERFRQGVVRLVLTIL